MHNLISHNQLEYWKAEKNESKEDFDDMISDYFECLIDCNPHESHCKHNCRLVFS
jgi:GH35 family endo-1,4-beta-xylanase